MGHLNQKRYIDFCIVDVDSNPVPNRTLADWTITFTRNSEPCPDPLSLHDYGDGRYTITYTPSAAGHDHVEIRDDVADCDIVDIEDIDDSEVGLSLPVTEFNENHGGLGQLRVTESNPSSWALYVYKTSDWATGQRTTADAVGSTLLDAQGNCLHSVFVLPGTYNIVIRSVNTIKVIAYGLLVPGETDNYSDVGISITEGTGITITGSGSNYIVSLKIPVTVPHGGTGLTSGVSGGVLAFTSSGILASSAELTANAVVLGGGAGAAPKVVSWLGALNQVLTSQGPGAPPIWGDVLSGHDLLSVPHTDTDTSLNPIARGDLLVVNSALKWERFPKGTAHQFLAMGETAIAPEWANLSIELIGDGTVFDSAVSGSPTIGSGILEPSLCLQSAGVVLAGPRVAVPPNPSAKPTFRALEWPDLPDFPVFGLPHGGLGITSGTNGGILGFTAAGTLASSALLPLHGVVLGGGAGATPTALDTLGTAGQVLTSRGANAEPIWSQQNTIAGCVGYEPSMGGGLTLNIGPGKSFNGGRTFTPQIYLGGTLQMQGGCTNIVYLSPTTEVSGGDYNAPVTNYNSEFPLGCIPLYKVYTSPANQITSILDLRDRFVPLNIMTSNLGSVIIGPAVDKTNANLVLAPHGGEGAGSGRGNLVITGDAILFSPSTHLYKSGFNVFSCAGLYNGGFNLHNGAQYSDIENQQPSSLTQKAYFRLSSTEPTITAPLGFATIGVHVDHNPWYIEDQGNHPPVSYPIDVDAIRINLANGAVTFAVNPAWIWPWQDYANPNDPPLSGIVSTQRVINFNADRVGGTQFTDAATNRALAIGTGAGTAAWTTAPLGSIQGGTGNGFTKFAGPSTVEKTFTLPNATCTILTTNAVVTVAQGGTGITSGTNGGILGYTASGTLASSALLTAHGVMLGGGAGATPTALATPGNAGEVLTSQGPGADPLWAAGTGGGGGGGGLVYKFDASTAAGAGTDGSLRFDNAAIASVAHVYLNVLDLKGENLAALLLQLADSTSTLKAYLLVLSSSAFAVFTISAVVDHTTYVTLNVANVAGNSPTDAEAVSVLWFRTGDKGTTGAAGVDGNIAARGTVAFTTGSVADQAVISSSVSLGKSFAIDTIEVSCACRVRLYSTAACQSADLALSRPATQAPTYGSQHGVILDIVLDATTGLTWVLSPLTYGADCAASPDGNINYSVTNLSGSLQAGGITVTFKRTLEET